MEWTQFQFGDSEAPPPKKQKVSANGKTSESTSPRVRGDLVVNKKKIELVNSWLMGCCSAKGARASILLLTGPPGCGKLTTLSVLCSENNINLVEWLPPVESKRYDPEGNGQYYKSQSSAFEEFLLRATRYSNVLNSMSKRLVVVKDVPNCYVQNPELFHVLLQRISHISNSRLSFVVTDSSVARSLFPEQITNSLNIAVVPFNPFPSRVVKRQLQMSGKKSSIRLADAISANCGGDLRHAQASLAFALADRERGSVSTTALSKVNDFLDTFRGLGRVLYSKRVENGCLLHDPFDTAQSFSTCPVLFLTMLHENYLNTFSTVYDIAKSSNTLSTADLLSSETIEWSRTRETSIAVAAFGLMSQNSAPRRVFQQFNKPKKLLNAAAGFRSQFSSSSLLLDMVAYGRAIPSFAHDHSDLLSKLSGLR